MGTPEGAECVERGAALTPVDAGRVRAIARPAVVDIVGSTPWCSTRTGNAVSTPAATSVVTQSPSMVVGRRVMRRPGRAWEGPDRRLLGSPHVRVGRRLVCLKPGGCVARDREPRPSDRPRGGPPLRASLGRHRVTDPDDRGKCRGSPSARAQSIAAPPRAPRLPPRPASHPTGSASTSRADRANVPAHERPTSPDDPTSPSSLPPKNALDRS